MTYAPPEYREPKILWIALSGFSIAIHAGIMSFLLTRSVPVQTGMPRSGSQWVPVTLWTRETVSRLGEPIAAAPSAPPANTDESLGEPPPQGPRPNPDPSTWPTPPTAETSPTPNPSPNPTPSPNPNPSPNPTPSPNPNPTPSPNPSPNPNPNPNPSPNPSPSPNPTPNPSPTPGLPPTGNGDGDSSQPPPPTAFTIALDGLNLDNIDRDIPDAVAQVISAPDGSAIAPQLQDWGVTETVRIQTVIIVETNGTAEVYQPSATTSVLQGSLAPSQAAQIAQQLISLYRFSPTQMGGQSIPYDYTIVLIIQPS